MSKVFTITGSAKKESADKNQCPEISKNLCKSGLTESQDAAFGNLISINHNAKVYRKFIKSGGDSRKSVLIRLEPYSVYPLQYRKNLESKYGLILSPGNINYGLRSFEFIGWPYKFHLNPSKPVSSESNILDLLPEILSSDIFTESNWLKRQDKMVMIASNKVSPTSKSNYGLRRKIASTLPTDKLDLYGDMWRISNLKKVIYRVKVGWYATRSGFFPNLLELYGDFFKSFPTYKGQVENKHSMLQKYRFSLVVENDTNYISEKLIDSILNGTIPIYVGPKMSSVYLPENIYISSDGSFEHLNSITESITVETATKMLESIANFLNSDSFVNNWISENVYEKISKKIIDFWDQ